MLSLHFFCLSLMALSGVVESLYGNREEQEEYLRRFAYMGSLSPDPRLASMTNAEDIFHMAVTKFQMMAGLNATGTVDEETQKMMDMPRCGVPDEVGMGMVTKRRRRRYAAQGSRWPKASLTYRINNYTPDLSQQTTSSEIRKAFKSWSDASPLTFTEVNSQNAKVDIDINFVTRDHGDGAPFDGPGKTLAHAFFPQYGGDAHFDEDEDWTSGSYKGRNLLQVAIHEFGHSLGLSHSDVQESIMAPFYRGYIPDVKLHSDDIEGINYIYGDKRQVLSLSTPSSTSRAVSPTTRSRPSTELCRDSKPDAIFAVNNDVYLFKGNSYYVLDMRGVQTGFPKPITVDWPGLPESVDTAFYSPQLFGSIYFFKGDKFWRYDTRRQPLQSSPQPISSKFRGVPNDLDAAFIWSGNGKLYFIKGDSYYRTSKDYSRVEHGYPLKLKYWKGLPAKIDTAFNFTNSRTYFFSGSNFYRFNDVSFRVDLGYPKATADWWLGCSTRGPQKDMMTDEWMKGRDQFMTAGVRSPTSAFKIPALVAILFVIYSIF